MTATLLGLLVTTAIGRQLHYSRGFWTAMVTISVLLMMIASEVRSLVHAHAHSIHVHSTHARHTACAGVLPLACTNTRTAPAPARPQAFLGFAHQFENNGIGGEWLRRIRTVTAGAIMAVAFLIFLLLGVGTDWEHGDDHGHTSRHEKVTSGIPTTSGTTATVTGPPQNVRVVEQV